MSELFDSPSPRDHACAPAALARLYHHALATHFPAYLRRAFIALNPGQRYQHNWHLDMIAEYLAALESGDITRLIINMPPRSLKSLTVTVAWSTFLLGRDPARKIITASYASGLSLKHAGDARALLGSRWYRLAFPQLAIQPGQNEKHKVATTQHGFRLATSVGGTLTGEGGDIIIVDDPLNPAQASSAHWRERANRWFDHTLASRLDNKQRGCMLVVMQRLHEQDLTGHLLSKGGWEHVWLPAQADQALTLRIGTIEKAMQPGELLQPQREPLPILEQLRMDLGAAMFSAQYLQRPVPQQGTLVKREWLVSAKTWPPRYDRLIQSWDTAIKAGSGHDYSACVTLAQVGQTFYVVESWRERLDYPALRRSLVRQAVQHQPEAVLIEDKASGQSLLQDMQGSLEAPLLGVVPRGDKLHRLARITPLWEAGQIRLPPGAAWREVFEAEILAFPHGSHDDQVDALTQGVNWLRGRQGEGAVVRVL